MEIIKKQISLDKYKSHRTGALPYVEYGTGNDVDEIISKQGNYGHFVKDIILNNKTDEVIKYLDIINKYNAIEDILFHGIYCIAITDKNLKVLNDSININCPGEKTPPENFYDFSPLNIDNFIKNGDNIFKGDEEISVIKDNFYVLLYKYDLILKYNKWGVDKFKINNKDVLSFYRFTRESLIEDNKIKNYSFKTPVIEIPILIEGENNPDSLYYTYEYNVNENNELMEINPAVFKKRDFITTDIEVESKLAKLYNYSAINIGDDFYGILEGWKVTETVSKEENGEIASENCVIDSSKLFKCYFYKTTNNPLIRNSNVYQVIMSNDNSPEDGWWECVECNEEMPCNDGSKNIKSNERVYRNIALLSCIPYYVPNPSNGDVFYFRARYQNGKIKPTTSKLDSYAEIKFLTFPFKINEPINIESYNNIVLYDKINKMEYEDGYYNVGYIIGATSGVTGTGIYYEENLKYLSGCTKSVLIDGVVEGDLYYEKLDYDTNLVSSYNPELGLEIDTRIAKIVNMEVGVDYVKLPLITKEETLHLYNSPTMNVDILINRGIAAGWEKHFKLGECNTMRDLENYGNNVFNL